MVEYSQLKLGHSCYTGRSPGACKLSNLYNLRVIIILEKNVTKLFDLIHQNTKIYMYSTQ